MTGQGNKVAMAMSVRTSLTDVDGYLVPLVRLALLHAGSRQLDVGGVRYLVLSDVDLERASRDGMAIPRHVNRVQTSRLR